MSYEYDDENVICPHCKAKFHWDPCDYSEHETEEECFECGKTFIVWQEFTVTHYTKTKK